MEVIMNKLAYQEWEAWKGLVTSLEGTGAVTKEDSQSTLRENHTPGQRLYVAIRAWGDLLVELRLAARESELPDVGSKAGTARESEEGKEDESRHERIRCAVGDAMAWSMTGFDFHDVIDHTDGLTPEEKRWAKANLDWSVVRI